MTDFLCILQQDFCRLLGKKTPLTLSDIKKRITILTGRHCFNNLTIVIRCSGIFIYAYKPAMHSSNVNGAAH